MIIAALITVSFASCGKKSDNTAVVAAVSGKAEIIRNGDNPKQLKVKDILEINDVVITGADSFLSIKLGNMSMVNIVEKTNLKISSLGTGKEFFLENGKVYSKISSTQKLLLRW
jgi:hypothetical protein